MSNQDLFENINSLNKQIHQALDSAVEDILPIGLKSQHALLLHFFVLNQDASSSDARVALSLSKSSVSETIAVLVDRGYMRYEKSEEDARNKIVRITERGLDLHARVGVAVREFEKTLEFGISPAELETFRVVMDKIRWNIEEEGYGSR